MVDAADAIRQGACRTRPRYDGSGCGATGGGDPSQSSVPTPNRRGRSRTAPCNGCKANIDRPSFQIPTIRGRSAGDSSQSSVPTPTVGAVRERPHAADARPTSIGHHFKSQQSGAVRERPHATDARPTSIAHHFKSQQSGAVRERPQNQFRPIIHRASPPPIVRGRSPGWT